MEKKMKKKWKINPSGNFAAGGFSGKANSETSGFKRDQQDTEIVKSKLSTRTYVARYPKQASLSDLHRKMW